MKTLIVSGGSINREFALDFCAGQEWDRIIGVDAGTEFLFRNGLLPTDLVGDFDTISREVMDNYQDRPDVNIRRYRPEKDVTDTQAAVELALEYGSSEIYIIGGLGGRMDHTLANINILTIPLEHGVPCYLVDESNKICLLDHGMVLKKSDQYGKYVSFLPHTTEVKGLTLKGFKYPLTNHTLTCRDSLGVSNEIAEEAAEADFSEGILIMIQSRDWKDR
ncbi:thiamine diphosphokinase [Anaerobium acetethylicum]|uniref:Thiamine diphosphokinase n=1 Tax=Anaerobium acetethylicum TaxID=1619234 RepID=A0A1D3TVA8_9FIRM|nr:thiamine diphosphokinase [Anaerobium acetethylicum]SCP98059.1 thiamine pyrophosphokinase [Anaerobium acetethylicum]